VGKCGGHLPKLRRLIKRVSLCFALLALSIPSAPASAAREWKCPQWHTMLRKHRLPVEVFDRIMWRESRCNPRAVSKPNGDGSIDSGLLQINSSWRTLTARTCKRPARQVSKSLTDPSCNLKVAAVLWADGKGASNWRVTSGQ
jgi:soluble lytic murein transglycosylase-like protein